MTPLWAGWPTAWQVRPIVARSDRHGARERHRQAGSVDRGEADRRTVGEARQARLTEAWQGRPGRQRVVNRGRASRAGQATLGMSGWSRHREARQATPGPASEARLARQGNAGPVTLPREASYRSVGKDRAAGEASSVCAGIGNPSQATRDKGGGVGRGPDGSRPSAAHCSTKQRPASPERTRPHSTLRCVAA